MFRHWLKPGSERSDSMLRSHVVSNQCRRCPQPRRTQRGCRRNWNVRNDDPFLAEFRRCETCSLRCGQTMRQRQDSTAHFVLAVVRRPRIKSYFGAMIIGTTRRRPRLPDEVFVIVAATGTAEVHFTMAHDRHTTARERDESRPSRRQQINCQQQLRYVSLCIHRFQMP